MKINLILFLTIILFISCRKPADPVVEEPTEPVEDLLIYNHWGTFNTGGECLDLDISDILFNLSSGTATIPTFGSMVQKGKFSA